MWVAAQCLWILEIVKRNDREKVFKVLPKRWIVERTRPLVESKSAVEQRLRKKNRIKRGLALSFNVNLDAQTPQNLISKQALRSILTLILTFFRRNSGMAKKLKLQTKRRMTNMKFVIRLLPVLCKPLRFPEHRRHYCSNGKFR